MHKLTFQRISTTLIALLLACWTASAQSSLALSSSTVVSGGATSLNLQITSQTGTAVTGIQWTFTYSAAFSNITVTPGAASTNAGKTINCAAGLGSVTCLVSGMNANAIANGVVATLSATVTSSSVEAVGLSNVIGVDPSGTALAMAATGGTITVLQQITISSLVCTPASLNPGAASTCTVTLSSPAGTGGVTVGLQTTGNVSVASPSVSVAAGSTTANFTTTAGQFTSAQSATVTASLNGSSKAATISLVTAPVVSSLQCAASALASNASTSCTVTISSPAPSGGVSVTLSGAIPNVFSIPSSVSVLANATTAVFTASAASVTTSQAATITASLNGSSAPFNISLTPPVSISSLQCGTSTLSSLSSTSCTVTLSATAPSGGVSVSLSGAIANVFSIPASVSVAANTSSAVFSAATTSITTDQTATITASLNGSSAAFKIVLTAPVLVSSLQCSSASLSSNATTGCTVTLSKPASSSGISVTLSGAIPGVFSIPSSVSVSASGTTANFNATTATITTSQTATINASYGSSSAKAAISLVGGSAPTLTSVTCSPTTIQPGASGSCTVTISGPAPATTAVTLRSSNTGLQIPSSVNIATGATNAVFPYTTSTTLTGWLVITATLGTISKGVVLSATAASTTALSNLVCPTAGLPGTTVTCQITLQSPASRRMNVRLSSGSPAIRVPALVALRAGQRTARFEAIIDAGATAQDGILTAQAGTDSTRTSIHLDLPSTPLLNAAGDSFVKIGSTAHIHLSTVSTDAFPVVLSAVHIPSGASFNPAAGDLEWTPTVEDLGSHHLVFTAVNAYGAAASKSLDLYVGRGTPELTALANAAGPDAPAACTPGAAARLTGRFLAGDPGDTEVWINGIQAGILSAASDRIDFLCPNSAPGTALDIVVRTHNGASATLSSVMQTDAPGLLTADGSGAGQALAFRSGSLTLVGLPSPRFQADPVAAGESVSVLATGIACDDSFRYGRPELHLGDYILTLTDIRPANGHLGICELTSEVPPGITGDILPLRVQVLHYDGTVRTSNMASIAVHGLD